MLSGSDAVRRARVSSMTCNSSSRDGSACEIYGFMDVIDLFLRSDPYFCLTRRGRPGFMSFSHNTTIVFSNVGVRSSSVSIFIPWCWTPQS